MQQKESQANSLPVKQSKPPTHPLHLPDLTNPSRRYKIINSIKRSSQNSSLGRMNSELTPVSDRNEISFPNIHSSRSSQSNESNEEVEKTDPEISLFEKMNSRKRSKKNRLIKSTELKIVRDGSDTIDCESKLDEILRVSWQEIKKKSPQKIRKVIVPDIPKAKFGVHPAYNDLNIQEDFKTIEVVEKPREPVFKSRVDSLKKEEAVRLRVLSEILGKKEISAKKEEIY